MVRKVLLLSSLLNNYENPNHIPILVLSTPAGIFLTPGEPELTKYVNSSVMVTCIPSQSHLKVRWISPSGHVVSPIITERIHAEYEGNGACSKGASIRSHVYQ